MLHTVVYGFLAYAYLLICSLYVSSPKDKFLLYITTEKNLCADWSLGFLKNVFIFYFQYNLTAFKFGIDIKITF